jgi:tetratricopeptide (TPR) repeat protein
VAIGAYFAQDRGVFYTHAESEYVQVLVEGGLVGAGCVVLALASLVRLGRRACMSAESPQMRASLMGAVFGVVALAVQSLTDFPLHIPALAVTAVVVVAYLIGAGIGAAGEEAPAPERPPGEIASGRPILVPVLVRMAMLVLAVGAAGAAFGPARAEVRLALAGLPLPGTRMPSVQTIAASRGELEQARDALELAVTDRPDWWEGHLRLGDTYLGLYEHAAREWLEASGELKADDDPVRLADPVWLHAVVDDPGRDRAGALAAILEHEPVTAYLLPAAECYLEARRCCPLVALSHTRLAILDYLLKPSEPTVVHVERALRLAGADSRQVEVLGLLAAQAGDQSLAARCWRRALELGPADWTTIADAAAAVLRPETILDEMLPPDGRLTIEMVDRLYPEPADRPLRELFLRRVLEGLPRTPGLQPIERTWREAQIRARLGEVEPARAAMQEAVRAEPQQAQWREELVSWLLVWGDPEEAHRLALVGTRIFPEHPGLQQALQAAREALARRVPGAPQPTAERTQPPYPPGSGRRSVARRPSTS